MAVTWTPTVEDLWVAGGKRHARVKLVGNGTYTAGGDAIPAFGALGMKRQVDYISITGGLLTLGYIPRYDQAGKKLLLMNENDAAAYTQRAELEEIPAATNITTATLYCEVVGN